jgi:putative SOS response-associated peptidase YedK
MCGRYGLYDITDAEFLKENTGYDFKPNYNVAPTQTMPVITSSDSHNSVELMKWGIPRKLSKDTEKSLINTRSEKAFERFWGKTVKQHRCLVPANGFYEWQASPEGKIPFWIHSKNADLMYFAGIYDIDSEGHKYYSIMTTSPNKEMEQIHNRMPVILEPDKRIAWLSAGEDETGILEDILRPLHDGSLEMHEVSRDVNTARTNNGQLILPINSA